MNKIFVIAGKSCSGKDIITKSLEKKLENVNIPIERLLSFTTRPIRKYEINGVDYCFTDIHNFDKEFKNENIAEYNTYKVNGDTWFYYTKLNQIHLDKTSYIKICNPVGISQLRTQYKDKLVVFYIDCPRCIREERYSKRNDNADTMTRRFNQDDEDFLNFKGDYNIINDGMLSIDDITNFIIDKIIKEVN